MATLITDSVKKDRPEWNDAVNVDASDCVEFVREEFEKDV
jgi:hypothetical protein